MSGADSHGETIQQLPLTYPLSAIEDLRKRYHSFDSIINDLPPKVHTPENIDLGAIMNALPDSFFVSPNLNSTGNNANNNIVRNQQAFAMALFGWQNSSRFRITTAECRACFRTIGLFIFTEAEESGKGAGDGRPPILKLDVCREHRAYCPWKNPVSQSGPAVSKRASLPSPAGAELLARVITNSQHTRRESVAPPDNPRPMSLEGVEGEIGSLVSISQGNDEDPKVRDAKDKERWMKLRRLKSMFDIKKRNKSPEKKNGIGSRPSSIAKRPSTATG